MNVFMETNTDGENTMTNFKILAQSYMGSQRISKTVAAKTDAEAILLVSPELEAAGFYPLAATAQTGE